MNSGIVLALNEVVTVSASGLATYYGGGFVGPDGAEVGRPENLVPSDNWGAPTASLMARVGGGWWQFVGSGPTQIVAYQAGTLEFAMNDSNYADNGGGWNVSVTRPALPTATVTPVAPFSAVYSGTAKSVAFSTSPGPLGLDVRYNGGGQPSAIGAYVVRAKVTGRSLRRSGLRHFHDRLDIGHWRRRWRAVRAKLRSRRVRHRIRRQQRELLWHLERLAAV